MPTTDALDIMLAHDAWATRRQLELCRPLTRDQFHQRFDIGLGSLHDNLSHLIGAVQRWTDRLHGRPPRPMLLAPKEFAHLGGPRVERTPDQLIEISTEASAELAAFARQNRAHLDRTVVLDWPGKEGHKKRYTFTHAAVLVHVCTHGMHHRSQCTNMLRHLGVHGISDKLPDLSAVDWQAENEIPPIEI
jgi:uncharacterized damage-inducible protein DinB